MMEENSKALITVGVIFSLFIGYQLFTSYIPSIIESTKSTEEIEKDLPLKEKIKKEFQVSLEEFITKNENVTPKTFNEFVSYKENKPDLSTISIEKYSDLLVEENPVKGLNSKMLVLKIINPDTKEKEMIVLLLNSSYISLTKL